MDYQLMRDFIKQNKKNALGLINNLNNIDSIQKIIDIGPKYEKELIKYKDEYSYENSRISMFLLAYKVIDIVPKLLWSNIKLNNEYYKLDYCINMNHYSNYVYINEKIKKGYKVENYEKEFIDYINNNEYLYNQLKFIKYFIVIMLLNTVHNINIVIEDDVDMTEIFNDMQNEGHKFEYKNYKYTYKISKHANTDRLLYRSIPIDIFDLYLGTIVDYIDTLTNIDDNLVIAVQHRDSFGFNSPPVFIVGINRKNNEIILNIITILFNEENNGYIIKDVDDVIVVDINFIGKINIYRYKLLPDIFSKRFSDLKIIE